MRAMERRLLRAFVAAALCCGSAVQGTASAGVIVVGPGLPISQIHTAVAQASDGDILLVKAGIYDGFTIDAKGIAVVAEVGAGVTLDGGIVIKNLPAGRTVVLDRLQSNAGVVPGWDEGCRVEACAGPVRLQDCQFVGAYGTSFVGPQCVQSPGTTTGRAGVRVVNSLDVALTDCDCFGGFGAEQFWPNCPPTSVWVGGSGGVGIDATSSSVAVYGSLVTGGSSGHGTYSTKGADGIFAWNSQVIIVASLTKGGNGGQSFGQNPPGFGGVGGHGLYSGGGALIRTLDSGFLGGAQGQGWAGPGGTFAAPIAGDGVVTLWTGPSKALGHFKVVREGQTLVIGMSGAPGENALLLAALQTSSFLYPPGKGALLLSPASLIGPISFGAIGGTGVLNVGIPIPDLPVGLMGFGLHLQGVVAGGKGSTLTNFGHVTLLDASL